VLYKCVHRLYVLYTHVRSYPLWEGCVSLHVSFPYPRGRFDSPVPSNSLSGVGSQNCKTLDVKCKFVIK